MPLPTLDGSNSRALDTPGNNLSISLTTTQANDIILILSETTLAVSPGAPVGAVSGGSLSFGSRWSFQVTHPNAFEGTRFISNDCWWAPSAAVQTNTTFNVNYPTAPLSAIVVACGVSGLVNLVSPWDTNVSLPALNSNTSLTPLNVQATISTSGTNTFIFGFGANYENPIFQASPTSPWANIATPSGRATSAWNNEGSEYQAFASPQANLVVGVWSAGSTIAAWTWVADALGTAVVAASRPQVLLQAG